ncbi:hypothetical protein, partial [Bradyrhizobium sp. 144]|uniref:hypothetical protein n=1 Tax=Bradyrhizobium sp. 144 TaxID=2782620 RepID=UPI001FFB8BB4
NRQPCSPPHLIAITGIRDHHRLEHLITIPGMRSKMRGSAVLCATIRNSHSWSTESKKVRP